jgi:murein L,D-transpeptidase YcbB/YkuD
MSTRNMTIIKGLVAGLTIIFLYFNAKAVTTAQPVDQGISRAIKYQLGKGNLNYPLSVKKFYHTNTYKMAWIAPDTVKMHALEAMLLLDCVSQYGLDQLDFHPRELVYKQLQLLTELNSKADLAQRVVFDVLLTDAMVTLINHLHYGKLNPNFSASAIDGESGDELAAGSWLIKAMCDEDFMKTLLSVQPQSKGYRDLQDLMRLMTGQYIGDSYVVPLGRIKKVAVNLERLRWLQHAVAGHITINVPSHSLWYTNADQLIRFDVGIELPLQIVPMVETSLLALWTGTQISIPDKAIDGTKKLLFLSFKNDFHTYLPIGDHSQVYVAQAQQLAEVVLKNDGSADEIPALSKAMKEGIPRRFKLKTAVPVSIIYITCELKDGIFVQYPDPYNLDEGLESALYKETKINAGKNNNL